MKESKGKEVYKREIVLMLEEINNHGALEYLYTFIKLFLEKWG